MLKLRLTIGLPLAFLVLLAIFWPGEAGAMIFAGLAGVGLYAAFGELSSMIESTGVRGPHRSLKFFTIALLLVIIYSPLAATPIDCLVVIWPAELLLLTAIVLFCIGHALRAKDFKTGLNQAAIALGGLVFVYGSLNFGVKLYFSGGLESNGRYLLLFAAATTKLGDVGAYACGLLTSRSSRGNHKITPRLSPKKSWEGLAGGVLTSIIAALIIYGLWGGKMTFADQNVLGLWSAVLLGMSFGILGFFGDISESVIKRTAKYDDSGDIPGLGGVLDMVDSMIFVLPVFYAFIAARVMF